MPYPVYNTDASGNVPVAITSKGAQVSTPGNSEKATFVVNFPTAPTAAMDLIGVLAAAGKLVRLRRLVITNPGGQTTNAVVSLSIATAGGALGSGGSAVTPKPLDPADSAASSTFRTGDTTPAAGIVSPVNIAVPVWVPAAAGPNTQGPLVLDFGWEGAKCPTATATASLVIRHPGAAGAASFSGFAVFTEEATTSA